MKKNKNLVGIICCLVLSNSLFICNNHQKDIQIKNKQQQINKLKKDIKNNNKKLKNEQQLNNKNIKKLHTQIDELENKNKQLKKDNLSRGGDVEEITFTLTFYTSLNCENGYGAITCNGHKLRDGIVANNVLPQGTKIKLQGYGMVEVADKGGNNFDTKHRLDVFIPRQEGESNSAYYKRVNNMGSVKVKGWIIK